VSSLRGVPRVGADGSSWTRPTPSTGIGRTTFRAMISVLTISGMLAVHSKRAVFTALSGVPGVAHAEVELGRAVVDHGPDVTRATLAEALSLVGCELMDITTERRLPIRE